MGNLTEQSLEEVWSSERLKELRSLHAQGLAGSACEGPLQKESILLDRVSSPFGNPLQIEQLDFIEYLIEERSPLVGAREALAALELAAGLKTWLLKGKQDSKAG